MSSVQWKKFWRRNSVPQRANFRAHRLACEPLESRQMLTLLGVAPILPSFTYDSTGHITYTASAETFDLTATPLSFKNISGPPHGVISTGTGLAVHVLVDNSGNLISGTPGNDLEIDGTVTPDGNPLHTVSGVLLTGEVTGFGFQEAGSTDLYDFRFTPSGGLLESYWSGNDIAMTVTSENSTFNNDFSVDFQGGAKGNVGNVAPRPVPSLVTNASETVGGVVGSAVLSDSATLSSANTISGGSITFTLTAPDGNTSTVGTVPVSAAGTYNAPNVTATEVGTYTWHASYSGDAFNNVAVDDGTNESVTTVDASPSISTSASETVGGVVGSSVLSDSATLSGGYNISGGSITFSLTSPDGNTSTVGTVPVTATGTYNAPTVTATEVGTYTWHASYSGDGLNNGAIDNGANESVTTVNASPAISTSASESAGGVVGSAVLSDSATISGGYNVSGGSITFTITAPNGGTSTVGTVPVTSAGTYNAPTVTATQVGTYTWHASYSGDSLNNGAIDNGANESVTTVNASPAISTSASESAGGVVGSAVLSDSATISGGYNVSGGSITFTITAPNGSTSTVGTVPVTSAGTYNAPNVTATQVGTYTWHASYNGDSLNNGAIDNGTNESLTTVKASPAISTSASEVGNVVGSAVLSDSATISGGYHITGGSITFTITAPNGSTSTVGTVPVTAAGTYNAPTVTATQVGTYVWHASYSGDGLNNAAVDNGVNESLTVIAQQGTISGTKYFDVTGNGMTPDDTPMAGVRIYLDTNNDGIWESTEPSQITGANGTYAFTGLAAGTYTVREVNPTGYVRTGPALSDHYTITLGAGATSSGNNFDDAEVCNLSIVTNIVYVVNGTTPVTTLQGNTYEGDTVEVSFTVVAGTAPHPFTLVSYTAPGPTYDPTQAYKQQIFDVDTGVFGPGNYTLSVTIPHSYYQVDFVCGSAIDHFGLSGSNIFYGAQGRLFSSDNSGTHVGAMPAGSLSGNVYLDANNNGVIDSGERAVAGVTVTLAGTLSGGGTITQTVLTDTYGVYRFDNLTAGTYTITETRPITYTDGKDTLGNKGGTVSTDKFSGIVLSAGAQGTSYNFGEQQVVGAAFAGNQTGSSAFWNGTSGQALIKALNGSSSAKNLGNWLAANFNNMFGASAGTANNLTGQTNAQVAAYFQTLFANSAKKLEAENMALALSVYVTNSGLAGTTASSYGFAVSATGLGASTVNVGSNGAAFGVSNNAVMTVTELLQRTNARARNGLLWDTNGDGILSAAETSMRNMGYSLFTTINNT